ncbi:HlyD family efflux transporter periplasmic adaptor subunit [Mangrovimicrobium sediminis]|uniref:HlyD family efflux transporter periplasmic adaptor subunit n=1 Tax=Mangrovimicrobium sediminis TaxID=2562682 RepID=A0A4Z0M8Y3_9GAMM|nr:HlyD family efflux transporter periplasmic adaptor subunit [Haliea sp. SAOS-164]TGD75837.1 HlyD family efflux transporter periplasmic adaptor subunit [Haliea sp. SAOS-164]
MRVLRTLIPCALLTGWLTACLSGCGDDSANQALGTLERDRIILRATAAEIVLQQPVPEGTQVTAGTLLVQLDDSRQKAVVARARAEVARAAAVLEELRNGARPEEIAAASARVSGARAALTEAEANFTRAVSLVRQRLAAQAELDRAQAARDEAEANLQSAQEDLLRLTNGTRQEQLDAGAAALQAAEAQLAVEQNLLEDLSVEATRDAYLDSLPWNEGERVTAGSTLAVLLADTRPYARVYVPEPWRARLHIGDSYPVQVDGVNGQLTGTLRWVSAEPAFTPYYALNASDRSRLVYLAEFDLAAGEDLPTGIPAQVLLGDD